MRLKALDGMRGLFAVWVALVHLPILSSVYASPLLRNSHAMLSVFFVFSGFVVAMMYGRGLSTPREAARFVLKRFGRLWPLHAATLAFLVALEALRSAAIVSGATQSEAAPFTSSGSITGIFEHLFLVQAWGWDKPMEWNYPSWTISTEFAAYAFVCVICMLTPRVKHRIALGAGASIIACIFYALQSDGFNVLQGASVSRSVMDFFIGFAAFFVWKRWPLNKAPLLGSLLEVGLLSYTIFVAAMHWGGAAFLSCSLAFGVLVWVFSSEQGIISRVVRTPFFVWLGDISLAIYLVHVPVAEALSALLAVLKRLIGADFYTSMPLSEGGAVELIDLGVMSSNDAVLVLSMILVIVGAALAHMWIEHPARVWFARLADRWLSSPARARAPTDGRHPA